MSEIMEEICSGCEGDECCEIQILLRTFDHRCLILGRYSELDGNDFIYFSMLNNIKAILSQLKIGGHTSQHMDEIKKIMEKFRV